MSSKVEIQTNPATATPSLSPPSSSASTSVPPSSNKSTTTTKNNDNDNNKTSAQQDEVPMKRKNSATSNGSSASTTPPKRHRPMSLNLGVPDNADVALRIVSPGLPPLINESMKTTVQLLKQIQQQQKNLIAARHGKDPEDEEHSQPQAQAQTQAQAQQPTSIAIPASGIPIRQTVQLPPLNQRPAPKSPVYASDDSDLNRLSNVKKLKRLNVPPPLSIGESSGSGTGNNSNNNLRPSIHSAPIRSRAPTRPTPRAIPPTRIVPQIAIPPQPQYYYVSTPYQQYYPAQIVGATPTQPVFQPLPRSQLRQVNPRVRMIPLSSTTTHFGRRTLQQGPSQLPPGAILQQQQQQQQSLPLQQQPQQQPQSQQAISLQSTAPKPKPNAVTDVFRGDFHKAAPLHSQPLSAQREYFENSVHDEPPQKSQVISIAESQEISGSITINGSNVFNFKIFNKNEEEKSNDSEGTSKDNTSGKKQEGTLEKEEEPTDEEGKGESNVTEEKTHKSTKLEDLEEDNKKKFLKICETCWDQVFNKRDD